MKPSFLLTQIKGFVEQLAQETDEARRSKAFKAYLDTSARFWRYSWRNQVLILLQCPAASRVAGFRAWQELGRRIVGGSKAIRILAPFTKKVEETDKETGERTERKITFFVPVAVFDVSQTTGKPLPALDVELSGNGQQGLLDALQAYCKQLSVVVEFQELRPGLYGFAKPGKIVVSSKQSIDAQAATLLHEIAHVLLHFDCKGNGLDRQAREVQAEGVA